MAPYGQRMRPRDIRFTQDSIGSRFTDERYVSDTFKQLLNRQISVDSIEAIEVVEEDGNWWALTGNRRLYVYRILETLGVVDVIPVHVMSMSNYDVRRRFSDRKTTDCDGRTIEMRQKQAEHHIDRAIKDWQRSRANCTHREHISIAEALLGPPSAPMRLQPETVPVSSRNGFSQNLDSNRILYGDSSRWPSVDINPTSQNRTTLTPTVTSTVTHTVTPINRTVYGDTSRWRSADINPTSRSRTTVTPTVTPTVTHTVTPINRTVYGDYSRWQSADINPTSRSRPTVTPTVNPTVTHCQVEIPDDDVVVNQPSRLDRRVLVEESDGDCCCCSRFCCCC